MQQRLLTRFYYLFISLSLFLTACDDESETPVTPEPQGKYSNGFFILNEGNFSDGDGSITFFNYDTEATEQRIYQTENNLPLGGIAQNMKLHNGKAYVVTNRAGQLLILDAASFVEEAVLTGLTSPFDFAAVGDKGYLSVWGSSNDFVTYPEAHILVLDLNTNQTIKTIEVGQRVAGMLAHDDYIYAALEEGNEILRIDPNTDAVVTRIETPQGPSKMVVGADNKIWALCTSGAFVRLNTAGTSVEQTITGISSLGYNEKLAINPEGTVLYWIASNFSAGTGAVFSMGTTATEAPAAPLFLTNYLPYGIGINPEDGLLYIGEGDFAATEGTVYRYSSTGISEGELEAGRAPSGFVFP